MYLRVGLHQLPHGHSFIAMLNLSIAIMQYRRVIHGKIQVVHIQKRDQKAPSVASHTYLTIKT